MHSPAEPEELKSMSLRDPHFLNAWILRTHRAQVSTNFNGPYISNA